MSGLGMKILNCIKVKNMKNKNLIYGNEEKKLLLMSEIFFVFVYLIIVGFLYFGKCNYIVSAKISGFFLLVNCLIFVLIIFKYMQQGISPLLLFYISFVIFGAGHLFLIAFGAEKDVLMYIWRFEYLTNNMYNKTIVFTTCSVLLFQLGCILSYWDVLPGRKIRNQKICFPINIKILVLIGFLIAFAALTFLTFLYRTTASNYADIYQHTYGSYYNMVVGLSLFLIPLYLLIQYDQINIWKNIATICIVICIVETFWIGRRGNGIMLLLPIVFIVIRKIDFTKHRIIKFIFAAVFLYFMINLLYTVSITRIEPVGLKEFIRLYFINFMQFMSVKYIIIEMGASIRNLMEVIRFIDNSHAAYKYGLTYLYSIIIILPGKIRNGLDQIALDNNLMNLPSYITEVSGASYGLGGSIQMEAYFNFSMWGVLFFLLFGYVIGRAFNRKHFDDEKFDIYFKICLLSFLIMLPRTCMQDNLKRIIFCCIIPFYFYNWMNKHKA